jgi:hypothetical protein
MDEMETEAARGGNANIHVVFIRRHLQPAWVSAPCSKNVCCTTLLPRNQRNGVAAPQGEPRILFSDPDIKSRVCFM